MTLAIAYQGEDFAALATDSLIPEAPLARRERTLSFRHGRKFQWACYKRIAYVISGDTRGGVDLPVALPDDALLAAHALAKWTAGLNPELAHVMAIGAPFGQVPTVHRVIIGSDPSITSLKVGDIAFAGGVAFLAQEAGMEQNIGPVSADVAPALLAAHAHVLIMRARKWASRQNDGRVASVDLPIRIALIREHVSTEQLYTGATT